MTKSNITEYDKVAANNTDVQDVPLGENQMYPSDVNNAFREIMADLAAVNDGTVSLTSPSFAAASLTGNLSFGDNNKAIFGAGSDLQIYHSGSNSIIADNGSGKLVLSGNGTTIDIYDNANGHTMASFVNNGAVNISYQGSTKLSTTSTGINVTGTVTADGLTVDQSGVGATTASFNHFHANADWISFDWYGTNLGSITQVAGADLKLASANNMTLTTNSNDRLKIASNGDISFYEDTGTTAKLFWDASAERLGIGTTSPEVALDVNGDIYARSGIVAADEFRSYSTALSTYGSNTSALHYFKGSVGIGTSSPTESLHTAGNIRFGDTAPAELYTNSPELRLGVDRNNDNGTTNITFYVDNSERVRIDSSGNLLVGTTTADTTGSQLRANGQVRGNSSAIPMFTNRIGSDGILNRFQKSGTTVGGIGTFSSTTFIYGTGGGVTDTGLTFANGQIVPCNGSGVGQDDVFDLGTGSNRFDDVFATNGTINTSDGNEKQDIEELTEAEQRVAVAAKGLLRKFRWKSRVEEKGDDARIHFGIIAQDLQAAFEAEGLDAGRYAMFTNSIWTDEETGEERSRMGVRYNQLLAFIIAAI